MSTRKSTLSSRTKARVVEPNAFPFFFPGNQVEKIFLGPFFCYRPECRGKAAQGSTLHSGEVGVYCG